MNLMQVQIKQGNTMETMEDTRMMGMPMESFEREDNVFYRVMEVRYQTQI